MKRVFSTVFTVLFLICSVLPICVSAESTNPVPKAKQAVVSIVAGITYDSSGEITYVDNEAGRGTGFGVGAEGEDAQTFVTNRHVVMVGEELYDTVYLYIDGADITDGKTLVKCDVLYVGEDADYAIIQAKAPVKGVATLPLLPAEIMETGEQVYALGFPGVADIVTDSNHYTVEDITVTDGIISRYITSTDKFSKDYGVPEKLIAHTASINHGNSGGPLINELGQVIGINTYGITVGTDNRYYATYIDYVMATLDELGIEYVDASKPVQQKEEPVDEVDYGVVIAVATGAVILAVILFLAIKNRKKENQADQLVVLATNGPLKGRMWELKGTLRVGRDPDGEIVYPPETKGVSRKHCIIRLYQENNEKYVQVEDVGSTYGTFSPGSSFRPGTGSNYISKGMKGPAKDFHCEVCVGSEENRLLITRKNLADKRKERESVGGK